MSEYLVFRPAELEDVDPFWMVENGIALSPHFLGLQIQAALNFLTTELGPNLSKRKSLVPEWMGWWINFISNFSDDEPKFSSSGRLVSLNKLSSKFGELASQGYLTAAAFAATMEGTVGHRYFLEEIKHLTIHSAIGLEGQGYFDRHPERRPACLPLSIRMRMVALLGHNVFPIPDLPSGIRENTHYEDIFARTKALFYCFTWGDSHENEKRRRGVPYGIPEARFPHSSDLAERLMPEIGVSYLFHELRILREQHYFLR